MEGATEAWELIDRGGVIAVLVIAVVYLAAQNYRLTKRNEALVDRQVDIVGKQAELAAEIHATLDRLVERLRG